jgi:hypothetical protein
MSGKEFQSFVKKTCLGIILWQNKIKVTKSEIGFSTYLKQFLLNRRDFSYIILYECGIFNVTRLCHSTESGVLSPSKFKSACALNEKTIGETK